VTIKTTTIKTMAIKTMTIKTTTIIMMTIKTITFRSYSISIHTKYSVLPCNTHFEIISVTISIQYDNVLIQYMKYSTFLYKIYAYYIEI